jgi:hypothetical protein
MDHNAELLGAICEIRELVRLIAEPQIAARDKKLRDELTRLAGRSVSAQKALLLMDGNRTQTDIHRETNFNKGNLSTLVKRLSQGGLLAGDSKKPKLAITIPSNFFKKAADE